MNIKTGLLPHKSNYRNSRTTSIKYIVIHYTGGKGDTAANNVKCFANNVMEASAHYFVDENNIYTSVPEKDTAWHCGGGRQTKTGGKWFGKCTNANSIGIEMCLWDKKCGIRTKTISNTIELTKYLMKKHNIPSENVIRHWDVVGKHCPQPFVGDNNPYWNDFKKKITVMEEIDMEELKKLQNEVSELSKKIDKLSKPEMIYNYIDNNMPDFAKPTIQKLCDKGFLKGDKNGLNLDYNMLRLLVILDRSGIFD